MFTTNAPAPVDSALVLTSGGMDSAVALALARRVSKTQRCICFDYGQKHTKEIEHAKKLVDHYGHTYLSVYNLPVHLASETALGRYEQHIPTEKEPDLPHYTLLPKTWVPGRNIVMLAYAGSMVAKSDHKLIVGGWHQEDYPGYPDCRSNFLIQIEAALREGLAYDVSIWAPLLHMTKHQIVDLGNALEVPWDLTWSCYEGGDEPCGKCDACIRRAAAFKEVSE